MDDSDRIAFLEDELGCARADVDAIKAEVAALEERIDLDVDEFLRIRAELDDLRIGKAPTEDGARVLYDLVSGICDRAINAGRQRVPMIEQRDRAQRDRDILRAKLLRLTEAASKVIENSRWPCHWCGGSGPRYPTNHSKTCCARGLVEAIEEARDGQ